MKTIKILKESTLKVIKIKAAKMREQSMVRFRRYKSTALQALRRPVKSTCSLKEVHRAFMKLKETELYFPCSIWLVQMTVHLGKGST
jgi:hypothetical protein